MPSPPIEITGPNVQVVQWPIEADLATHEYVADTASVYAGFLVRATITASTGVTAPIAGWSLRLFDGIATGMSSPVDTLEGRTLDLPVDAAMSLERDALRGGVPIFGSLRCHVTDMVGPGPTPPQATLKLWISKYL